MNTHLSEDFCLYRSQFGYPYPGLFNPLRCNYEYALTGSDNEGTKKQEETKKKREKKRMSQLMYSTDSRRQRMNERLRLKLENRKTGDENESETKKQIEAKCLSEQDLFSLFETNEVKETKKKKKKKKRKKKKEKEKVVLKKEEMELLEEEIFGSSTFKVANVEAKEEKKKTVTLDDVKEQDIKVDEVVGCNHSPEENLDISLSVVQDEKDYALKNMVENEKTHVENNDTEEEAEKSCGETNSIESTGNVTERGSLSVEEHQEQDANCLGPDDFDPAWLLFLSDHEREDEKPDNGDDGFIIVKRKEKRPKPNKKSSKQYRRRARRRRDRGEGRHGRRRWQRNNNNDDGKTEKSPKNINSKTSSPNVINSCPIKQISSNRQQPIFIPQPHKTQAPSLPSIIQEEKEKEKLIEREPTPSESETTQYFIMPIPEIHEPRTHLEKCDPTLIQQDYSSPHHSASTSKSPSPTRPPPGFETAPVMQPPPINQNTMHYQPQPQPPPQQVNPQINLQVNPPQPNPQIPNPQMMNVCHYPQQPVSYEQQQQPHQVMMNSPTHLNPVVNPEVPPSKPFHYQQCDSVMYLYLPSEQVLKIPMCPEERCPEEIYRMNLDLSYPVTPSEIPQPAFYFPVVSPVQQNGVFMYPEQGNMIPAPQPPMPQDTQPYMVPADPTAFVPYLNPEDAVPPTSPEMFTPMMYTQC